MAHHIFQLETELQNIPEKLARYGSSALSGMEHLRLLVGKDSHADALLRHFGSLKALSQRCLALFNTLVRTRCRSVRFPR